MAIHVPLQETFTLSYITGRSVGIGAYLNRLGQRNIQMVSSPMILTGYSALNKLLGKNVYSSQDQLGGPQIMVPNGVTHQVVRDDQEGMSAILDWLSFVPKDVSCPPPISSSSDPWDRDVEFEPSPLPYDPRDFLRGVIDYEGRRLRGFFDAGSFTEYLEGWGQTVVVGRARLGGIPMGVIAVETRAVERLVPADPSNPESREMKETGMRPKTQRLIKTGSRTISSAFEPATRTTKGEILNKLNERDASFCV